MTLFWVKISQECIIRGQTQWRKPCISLGFYQDLAINAFPGCYNGYFLANRDAPSRLHRNRLIVGQNVFLGNNTNCINVFISYSMWSKYNVVENYDDVWWVVKWQYIDIPYVHIYFKNFHTTPLDTVLLYDPAVSRSSIKSLEIHVLVIPVLTRWSAGSMISGPVKGNWILWLFLAKWSRLVAPRLILFSLYPL